MFIGNPTRDTKSHVGSRGPSGDMTLSTSYDHNDHMSEVSEAHRGLMSKLGDRARLRTQGRGLLNLRSLYHAW